MLFSSKKFIFTLSFTVFFFSFLCFNVIQTKAQEAQKSVYEDSTLNLEEVMIAYHDYINETFNIYIEKMLKTTAKNPNDPNGKPLKNAEECLKNSENFSTYCLAVRLLGDDTRPQDAGYFSYKKALTLRKNQIFDNEQQKSDAQKTLINAMDSATAIRNVIARQTSIEREIKISKESLDRTLAAYDELYKAWPMHQKYTSIFKTLTVYRDKLAELRSQIDEFPARFIDVTTAQCT